jgi:hypothetical protein
MQVSRLDRLGKPTSAGRQGARQVGDPATRRKAVAMNPWVVTCVLAIAGWSVDSMLVSIELHRLDGGDIQAHMTHLWYGPPILLALLLLMRAVLPRAALWVPRFTADSIARCGRRSGVKRLADRLAAHPAQATLVGVLLRYPNTAMTTQDLAGHAALPQDEVDRTLSDLTELGLAEELKLAGTCFYRLARQGRACDELRELLVWHRVWQSQADRLFSIAGPGSGHGEMEVRVHREKGEERKTWEKRR